MLKTMNRVIRSWSREMLLVMFGIGLIATDPSRSDAQTCNSDRNHYHSGADHCDSGGSGCTVVCP